MGPRLFMGIMDVQDYSLSNICETTTLDEAFPASATMDKEKNIQGTEAMAHLLDKKTIALATGEPDHRTVGDIDRFLTHWANNFPDHKLLQLYS